jgi:hypothetical protein
MAKLGKRVGMVLILGTVLMGLCACQNKEDGPAEHAGKAIDNAAAKVGATIEKAGESIQEAAKGDGKPKVDDKTDQK